MEYQFQPFRYTTSMRTIGSILLSAALSYALYILFTADMFTIDYEHRFYQVMSSLNFVIHKAGHLLLVPGQFINDSKGWGQFVYLLGGSLLQWGIPIMLTLYFYLRREMLPVGTMLFWVGLSFYDSVDYIADAQALKST